MFESMTELEKYLMTAIGFGIVAVATFVVRVVWVVLPRNLAQNERNVAANERTANTIAWLPHVMWNQELRFENALQRGLQQIGVQAAADTEKTRQLFESMFDRMADSIERRLSGQEQALHETQVEMVRTKTGQHAAAGTTTAKMPVAVPPSDPPPTDPDNRPTVISPEAALKNPGRVPRVPQPSSPGH